MKAMKMIGVFVLLSSSLIFLSDCKKESNKTNISSHGESDSHNMGKNCMECHNSGGSGEGSFTVAGTAYDSTLAHTYANVTVKLYSQQNAGGSLIATIVGDANGNFYTTENINVGAGAYPIVYGANGSKYMHSQITSGACNSCHDGNTTDKVWTR